MLMAWQHQFYELLNKAGLLKGIKNPEISKTLKARVATLKQNEKAVTMRAYLQMKSTKLMRGIIQALTEREVAPDKDSQTLDG